MAPELLDRDPRETMPVNVDSILDTVIKESRSSSIGIEKEKLLFDLDEGEKQSILIAIDAEEIGNQENLLLIDAISRAVHE
jgi:hypothetical protein